MSKAQIQFHLKKASKLVDELEPGAIDRRLPIVNAAQVDCQLWYVFPKQREAMKQVAMIEGGWNYAWGDGGECAAFVARWLRAGGVYCVDGCAFGEVGGLEGRTVTPFVLRDHFKLWGRWMEGADPATIAKVGPGDMIYTTDVETGHVGIVESVDEDLQTINTIEANYSNSIKEVRRTRFEKIVGFGSVG